MFTLEYAGIPLTMQKVTPGNTATGFGAEMYKYTERTLVFSSGGTTEIVAGDWIVGASSGARAKVISVGAITGAWAVTENAAGTLTICSQQGTFQSENIKVAAGTNDATITANSVIRQGYYPNKGAMAKYVLIVCGIAKCLLAVDGSKPDQTLLMGISLGAGSATSISDLEAIKNFKCIDYAASTGSTLDCVFYF